MLELIKTRGMVEPLHAPGGQIPCICNCSGMEHFRSQMQSSDQASSGGNIQLSEPGINLD